MSTENENTLEMALEEYFDHFGSNYPLCIGKRCPTNDEIIASIHKCISTNTPMEEPVYKADCDY